MMLLYINLLIFTMTGFMKMAGIRLPNIRFIVLLNGYSVLENAVFCQESALKGVFIITKNFAQIEIIIMQSVCFLQFFYPASITLCVYNFYGQCRGCLFSCKYCKCSTIENTERQIIFPLKQQQQLQTANHQFDAF